MIEVITSVHEMAARTRALRTAGHTIGLVPTMGALHIGHGTLFAKATATTDVAIASIFVNPLQFTENSDFVHYPRDLDADCTFAESLGVAVVFAPAVDDMYPDGEPAVTVSPGPMGEVLEGSSRPGHFAGVATVVTKLFAAVAPDVAFFGEKDFQQLAIIRQMVTDLSFPIEIVGCPTVRDLDGCALSSRNRLLSPRERFAATVLHRALIAGATAITSGEMDPGRVEQIMSDVVADEPLATLDYAVVRNAQTLQVVNECSSELRLLIAARLGAVRLIDNEGVTL